MHKCIHVDCLRASKLVTRITDLPAVMNASMELSLNSSPDDVLTALYTNIQHDIIITTKNNSINIILRCDRRVYTTPC